MIKKLLQAAIVAVGGLALGGCPLEQAKTTAPASKPPAADYQAAAAQSPPATNIRGICYNPADLAIYRARIRRLEIDELVVRRLRIIEQLQTPPNRDAEK